MTPERGAAPDHRLTADGALMLWLGDGCIETCARRLHRRLTGELLAGAPATPERTRALALLEPFLAATDFARLRGAHRELAGDDRVWVVLRATDDGAVGWELV